MRYCLNAEVEKSAGKHDQIYEDEVKKFIKNGLLTCGYLVLLIIAIHFSR
jgi:hypothetical protein